MATSLELNKSSKTCEVRLTSDKFTKTHGLDQNLTSPEANFPLTPDISFFIEALNTKSNETIDYITILLKYKVEISFLEEQTLWTKLHVYSIDTTPSGETQKRLMCGNGKHYTQTKIESITDGFANLLVTSFRRSNIIADNKIDLLVILEETYAAKVFPLKLHSGISNQSGLSNAFEDAHFKDIKFVIGDESLMAHKVICASRSRVFHAMFASDTRERQQGIVEIQDTRKIVFEVFIKFFYTAKINNMEEYAEELLILADKYDVQDLKRQCENYLSTTLNKDNAVDLLINAEKYSCQNLKENALEVVKFLLQDCTNFDKLCTHPILVKEVFCLIDEQLNGRPWKRKISELASDDSSSENSDEENFTCPNCNTCHKIK